MGTLTRGAVTTSIVIIAWTPPPPDATLLSYQIEYGRPGRQDGRVTRTAQSSTRSTLVSGLLPGTTYEFIVRGLFTGGLVGADRSLVATTNEAGKWVNFHIVILSCDCHFLLPQLRLVHHRTSV